MSTAALYNAGEGFGPVDPADDLLHPDVPELDDTLSETSYFGFNVPEAQINCMIYHWFHPRFDVASGGVILNRGITDRTAEGTYVDYRNITRMPKDLSDATYESGVRVRIITPLEEMAATFESPDGTTSFDVHFRAVMPAAGRPDRKHFAQAMHVTGTLTLDGQTYPVDSHYTRDRSYQFSRPELSRDLPPVEWTAAVFGDDLAFHVVAVPGEDLAAENVMWGYVWRDDTLLSSTKVRMVTHRAEDGLRPSHIELDIEDEEGVVHSLQGRTISHIPMNFWPNMTTHLALCEWTYAGRTGYGDVQDCVFAPWIKKNVR